MQEPLTALSLTENQRNVLSVALLNSERMVALLNQALLAANARIAELEASKRDAADSDHLKIFAGGPPYDEPNTRVGNGADA